jgi:hypothetical protein
VPAFDDATDFNDLGSGLGRIPIQKQGPPGNSSPVRLQRG